MFFGFYYNLKSQKCPPLYYSARRWKQKWNVITHNQQMNVSSCFFAISDKDNTFCNQLYKRCWSVFSFLWWRCVCVFLFCCLIVFKCWVVSFCVSRTSTRKVFCIFRFRFPVFPVNEEYKNYESRGSFSRKEEHNTTLYYLLGYSNNPFGFLSTTPFEFKTKL